MKSSSTPILFTLLLMAVSFSVFSPVLAQEDSGKIVISEEDIEKMNVRKIADLLNQIPGVKAGEASVSIRGSTRVKVFLDGRPINDPTSSHGGVKWDMVSVRNIEKIEIYKGEGGVEFGDDSGGGVIVITTKRIEALHGNVEAYRGNLETQSYSMNCQETMGPFGLGISSGYDSTDGFRVNDDKEKWRVGAKLRYVVEEDIHFSLSGDYLKEHSGSSGLPEYPTPKSRKDQETFSNLFFAGVRGLKSKTYFNNAETLNKDPDRNLNAILTVREVGEDLAAAIPFGKWGKVDCGAGFELARASGNQFAQREEEAYWLSASKKVALKPIPLNFTVGLRGNFYSEFEGVINPELRGTFKTEVYTVQLSASRTNNKPSFHQRFNETSSTKPNPNLKMEKAENYSLSCFVRITSSFSWNVSVFYNELTDRISYVRGSGGIGCYENFGKVTYKGIENSLDWKMTDLLSMKISHSYLEAKDENTGNWLPCKAKHRVDADVFFRPHKKLSIIFNSKYVSGQYTRSDNTESVPGYFIADFRTEYVLKGVGIFCEIKNVFDKNYLYGDGYEAPPRICVVGLNYQF